MQNRVRMIAAAVAAALLLAGGAIAAVTATGSAKAHNARAGLRLHRGGGGRDLRTAGAYLGIPLAQLRSELASGRSLAQIAQATSGRSVAGLVSALLASKRERLAKTTAALPQRVQAEVSRRGGPGAHRARALGGAGRVGLAVASYLGVKPRQLRGALAAGKTLAQVAQTHGRSEAGLVAAIVTARREAIESATLAGAITRRRETALLAKLEQRVHRLVNRPLRAPHPG